LPLEVTFSVRSELQKAVFTYASFPTQAYVTVKQIIMYFSNQNYELLALLRARRALHWKFQGFAVTGPNTKVHLMQQRQQALAQNIYLSLSPPIDKEI